MFKKIIQTNVKEIADLAKQIAPSLKGGEVFGLSGPLGSGKTTFVKLLSQELGYKGRVTSPTFTLLQSYGPFKNKQGVETLVHHLDLYRIHLESELEGLELEEYLGKPGTISFLEWADKFPNYLKKFSIIKIVFESVI